MMGVGISFNYFPWQSAAPPFIPNTYIFDDFNRADNSTSMGNAVTGQPWIIQVDAWGIFNNQAHVSTSAGQSTAVIDSLHADNIAIQVTFALNSNEQRLIFRYGGIANHWYVRRNGANYELVKFIANSPVSMGTFTTTPASNDVIRVELYGSSIAVKINGNEVITADDSFNQSATIHGIGSLSNNTPLWDDFSVTEIRRRM